MSPSLRFASAMALGLAVLAAGPASAQDLRIGFKAAVDGADPHQLYTPNRNANLHVWEPLLWQDAKLIPQPRLAVSHRVVNPTTWEFTLREGVKFSDGTSLTAEDVVFSIRRAQTTEGLRTYRIYVRDIASAEVVNARTVRIITRNPAPLLPNYMTTFGIVSARAAKDAQPADFNGGRAAPGTGPYRWIKLTPGANLIMERNPDYWGEKEPWQRVEIRFVPNDSARVAALLAGDLDVIDTVPPGLHARVRGAAQLLTETSNFTLYMHLDQFRDVSPFVADANGQPMTKNPLRDVRVRRAINHAINRTVVVERAMEGAGVPTAQFMADGFVGHVPDLPPPAYDPALSRRLLAEAGYPNGFSLTLHCTADRYAGDGRVCQAVAQMLTAVGIRTQPEALPAAVFFRRAGSSTRVPEFSAQMSIYGGLPGITSDNMAATVRTVDPQLGLGAANRGRYSNPELDRLLAQHDATIDPARRQQLVAQAVRLAADQVAVVTVFHWQASWGVRRGLNMRPRGDQYTYATDIRPAR